jgi:hypothetical protein
MNTQEFIESLCRDLKGAQPPNMILATLILDGQPPSTGIFGLESTKCGQGSFQPTDESILSKLLSSEGILKVSGRKERLRVTNCHRCPAYQSHHFHLHFEVQEE